MNLKAENERIVPINKLLESTGLMPSCSGADIQPLTRNIIRTLQFAFVKGVSGRDTVSRDLIVCVCRIEGK